MDSSKAPGEWKQFIFFCWESPLSCVIGWCFPCLLSCSNARHLDKQGVVYSCFSCCNTPFANFLLRDEARKKFGIKGSDLEDLVLSVCCPLCVACQTAAEIEHQTGKGFECSVDCGVNDS